MSTSKMYTNAKQNELDVRDIFERTRLYYTVRLGNYSETFKLLKAGANVNVVDVFGNTPLSVACIDKPNIAIVRLLLEYHADVNLERPGNIDLLLECVLNCTTPLHTSIIKVLIEHGKNINSTDELSNRSCMHIVAITGYNPLAELLLKMGGIVNIRDNFKSTPMKIAHIHENFEILKIFQIYIKSI